MDHQFDIVRFGLRTGSGAVRQARRTGGFTLLEMMIAVSIIAIVLTAVYRLHSQTLVMNSETRFQTVAPLLAQRKLADLEWLNLTDLEGGSGDFGEDYAGFNWLVTITETESELLDKVSDNFRKIDVTISFTGSELTYNLRTYRFFPD